VNLGAKPWLGLPDDPHTSCGCYPSIRSQAVITKPSSDEKIKSILDARQSVAEYLQSIGKIEAFNDFTKDDICGLIRTAHDAVQESLKEQLKSDLDDEIPF
jgi:hypothetical protein